MTMLFTMILEIPTTVYFFLDWSLKDPQSILIQEGEKLKDLHQRLVISLFLFLCFSNFYSIWFDFVTALIDPKSESRLPQIASFGIYCPRDEKFSPFKLKDVYSNAQKAMAQFFSPQLAYIRDLTHNEFNSFEDVLKVYESGAPGYYKYPTPHVVRGIPSKSKLEPKIYGDQTSQITRKQIQSQLGGLTIEKEINMRRMFILNYHDIVIPYARKLNMSHSMIYASRTVLFLQNNGTLNPLAIKLSLPHLMENNLVQSAKC